MRTVVALIATLAATPAAAQLDAALPVIQVAGRATVETPPDVALLAYSVRGEGETADQASAALAARNKAIVDGVGGLLGAGGRASSGNIVMHQTRGRDCLGERGYGAQSQLSTGACAVTGYVATSSGEFRTGALAKVGTAVGLAARLGASDARVEQFRLADQAGAQRRATAAALRDARARAEAIAAGSDVRLGPVLSISDQNIYDGADIVVTGSLMAPPPPAPMAPPVVIDVTPRPITTSAQVTVRYAILP